MQKHGSKYFARRYTQTPQMESKGQNIFSESSHVAYQIKWHGA